MQLRRVETPYAKPEDVAGGYSALFGARMEFSAPAPGIVFDTDMLGAALIRTEAELDDFLLRAPAGLLLRDSSDCSVTVRVRRLFAEEGRKGNWVSVDEMATRLAMSPATLRRRLREEGGSMRRIREGILREAAVAGPVRGEETVAGLSRRLGFSEPSAFARAFRRWTGSSPGQYLDGPGEEIAI